MADENFIDRAKAAGNAILNAAGQEGINYDDPSYLPNQQMAGKGLASLIQASGELQPNKPAGYGPITGQPIPAIDPTAIVGEAKPIGKLIGQAMYEAPGLGAKAAQEGEEAIKAITKAELNKPNTLVHYSKHQEPLELIDPKYHGTGTPGAERWRQPNIPRSYYYEAGTTPESIVESGSHFKYEVERPNNILDIASPEGQEIYAKATGGNSLEQLIKEAGYVGYKNSAHPTIPNAVAVFEAQKPIKAEALNEFARDKLIAHKELSSIKEPHILFTTENPKVAGKTASIDEMLEQLKKEGYEPIKVKGKYGAEENSILVPKVSEKQAEKLMSIAKEHGQESAIYSTGKHHEMRYLNGPNEGKSVYGSGTEVFREQLPEDFYTKLPSGKGFSHSFDFNKLEPSGKKKYAEGGVVQNYFDGTEEVEQPNTGFQPQGVPAYDIQGSEPAQVTIDHSELQNALVSGHYSLPQGMQVPAFSPDGEPVTLDASIAPDAFRDGYRYATPRDIEEHKYGTLGQMLKTGLEHAASTATFGLSTGLERLAGVKGEDILARSRVNPGSAFAGDILGLITPMGEMGAAAKIVDKAGIAAAEKLGLGAAEQATGKFISNPGVINGMMTTATRGAVETGLLSAGDQVSKIMAGDPTRTASNVVQDVGLSSLIGGGISAPFGAVHPLWKAAKGSQLAERLGMVSADAEGPGGKTINPIVKKVMSFFGGVPEKEIDNFIQNREAIKQTPEFEELYNSLMPHVQAVQDNVVTGKATVQEAKEAFKDLQRQAFEDLRQKGFEASVAKQMAAQQLKTAQTELAQKLMESSMAKAKDVVGAVEALSDRVIQGSSDAYKILDQSGTQVSMKPFFDKGESLIKELRAEGTLESKAMAERLENYIDSVKFNGEELAAVQVKPLIQGLDKVSKYDWNATSFDKGLSRYYKQLRHELDSTLKDAVPEYREAMAPLAEDTQLLQKLRNYGSEESATRALKSIKNPDKFKNDLPALEALEQKIGTPLTQEIKQYGDPALRKELFKAMPELEMAEKTAAAVNDLKNPALRKEIEERLMQSLEGKTLSKAEQALAEALAAKEELKGITPATLESKLKSAMRGSLKAMEDVKKLPHFEGKSIDEVLKHISTVEAFGRHVTNGSRRANTFAGLGGFLAEMVGAKLMHGLGLGALLGAVTDKYGPEMTAKILDMYLEHGGKIAEIADIKNKDAVRYALAKILDSKQAISASGFKALAHYAESATAGDENLDKSAKAVFHPNKQIPVNMDTKKLKKALERMTPESMAAQQSDLSHYVPEAQTQVSTVAAQALSYLQNQKPIEQRKAPLDPKPVVSSTDQARYERTLAIAEHPGNILAFVKDGRITAKDVIDFKSMYPAAYDDLSVRLQEQMAAYMADGKTIPYRTRIGLSIFLGQPLDSTMEPMAIQSAQPMPQNMPQQSQGKPPSNSSMKGVQEAPKRNMTNLQSQDQPDNRR